MKRSRGNIRVCVALVCAAAFAGGCAAEQATFKALSIPGTEFDKAFDATKTVLERYFEIAQVDRRAGSVETKYRIYEVDAGLSRFPRAFLNIEHIPDELFTHRRRVRSNVRTEDGLVVVSLTVEKERLHTEASASTGPRQEYDPVSSDNPTRFGGRAWRQEESWSSVGSDRTMERQLLREIERELGIEAGED